MLVKKAEAACVQDAVIQLISPEAREKQMVFARWSTHKCINDLGFLQNLWWSDEAQGTLQSTSDEKAGLSKMVLLPIQQEYP